MRICLVVLMVLLCVQSVAAEVTVSIPDVSVIEEEYLSVPVLVSAGDGIIGGEIVVSYDPGLFSVREVVVGDFGHSFVATWYTDSIGVFALSDGLVVGDSLFFVVQFEAHGSPGESCVLGFSRVVLTDEAGGCLEVVEVPGSLTIMPEYVQVLGDVNCDGVVSSVDALLVMQHVMYGLDLCSEHNADVNRDGVVTLVDARLILGMVAGNA